MENNKKILVPTIVAVVTLILLVFGATYAYFTIGSTNNFGTKDLSATVEDMADAVVLEQIENELSLDVTRAMMSQDNKWTIYYASGSSTPANIAKISVAGEGSYACDYKIKVTKSASSTENDLHTTVKNERGYNDVYFRINKDSYDFARTTSFPITYSGTAYGITKNTPRYITSNLEIKNTSSNQNYLKGKDITLTLEVTEFDCYLNEADDSAPIYAIYDIGNCIIEDEGECQMYANASLAFYQNHDEINVGDTYDGHTVTEVYTNLNNTNYTSVDGVPWVSRLADNPGETSIIIEEPISPKNTAYWFSNFNDYVVYDLVLLDTSQVTNMSHMFDSNGSSNRGGIALNLNHFDTSQVTDMSYIFAGLGKSSLNLEISNWDTSNVTNMQGMFQSAGEDSITVDISNWDTSNVEDMSYMFAYAGNCAMDDSMWNIGNLARREVTSNGKTYIAWDTSKVTNMESMFNGAGGEANYSLDLTSWQVPLVTNHANFGDSSKITPPTWVN